MKLACSSSKMKNIQPERVRLFKKRFHPRTNNNKLKSPSTSIQLGDKVSKETIKRAEKAEKERAKQARKVQEKTDKTEKDRVEKARKTQEKTDKDEKGRTDKARKAQVKSDKTDKDRADKAEEKERSRLFENVLSEAGKSRGCCESCDYRVKQRGEYQPCKKRHEDSGPNKEFCADSSEPRYHPKNKI